MVLSLFVRPSCAPLLLSALCCSACRGAVACGYAPFPACPPRSCASPLLLVLYPPSCFLIAAFFTLSSTPCWSALLPGAHFSPASLVSWCVARLFRLPIRSLGPLYREWPRLFTFTFSYWLLATTCCSLTWELSCFSKIPESDKLLRRPFWTAPSRTQSTIRRQKPRSKISKYQTHLCHSKWHLHVSYVFADCSARLRVRALPVLLLIKAITSPGQEHRGHMGGRDPGLDPRGEHGPRLDHPRQT